MFRHLQEEPQVERRQASAPAAEGRRKPTLPWRAPHPLVRTVSPASVGVPLPSLFFFSSFFVGWAKRSAAHADQRSGESQRVGTARARLSPPYEAHPSLFDN